ncbi:MAG TPA: pyridoxal phosphate-dependent aminotransferase [Alphaproteobacteria bacterium]|nr:pyridoxal phosphate-dependent aminotransferase [Alphaproteobacteria bacterium]
MPLISDRMSRIQPSPTLAVTARAAELKALGQDVISLGAGEPDFDTPNFIKEAAVKALSEGKTKYTAVQGIPALRKAIVKKFQLENEIEYTPDQIIVGSGAKQVIFNAFLASLNPGDEVIIPAPYWVSYPDIVEVAEGVPVIVRCKAESQLKLTPESLAEAITPKTKWLILNSPNNPSGLAYTRTELEALAEVVRQTPHLYVLSDDIYEHLVYDGFIFTTLAQVAPDLKERILTVNGLSKTYAMTGWRLGYGAGPKILIEAMITLQSQSTSHATSITQEAAVVALEGPQDFIKEWVKTYTHRRDKALEILEGTSGLTCLKPQGAFYLYPSCVDLMGKKTPSGAIITSDTDLATYLLESAGVAVVPGAAFGLSPHFRISYATDTDLLLKACHRISQAIGMLK